ncbi:hypothetical protein BC829DRAFT_234512 [Chytridium lagenaria]|nr:hypothetical protein BC829DRAFT_234512 [Chytridium lagenaria]
MIVSCNDKFDIGLISNVFECISRESVCSMEEALPFIAGLLGILTIAYMRGTKEEPSKATMRMDMERNRDVVSLATLAELTKSHSIHLRESAVQLLLDRAISDKYFPQILRVCWNEDDPEMKQRGIAAIQQLTKIEENRNILHRWVFCDSWFMF